MNRKGAGTILLVGFVITVLIMTLATYMSPPEVKLEEGVHEDFVDTLAYMTTVVNTAAELPGGSDVQASFIDNHLKYLSEKMLTKQVELWYHNITVPLIGGGGENVIVIYTLAKGDTYFTGILGTNLTDIQYRIGEGRGGGGGGGGGGDEGGEGLPPFGILPSKWCFWMQSSLPFIGGRRQVITFHGIIFNLEGNSYEIKFDFDTDGRILWGQYISLEPFQIKRIFGPFASDTVVLGGTPGLTGLGGIAYFNIRYKKSGMETDQIIINPQDRPGSEATIDVYYCDDPYEAYRISYEGYQEGVEYYWIWRSMGADLFGIEPPELPPPPEPPD